MIKCNRMDLNGEIQCIPGYISVHAVRIASLTFDRRYHMVGGASDVDRTCSQCCASRFVFLFFSNSVSQQG